MPEKNIKNTTKKFSREFNGYSVIEVEEKINELNEIIFNLEKANQELKNKIQQDLNNYQNTISDLEARINTMEMSKK